jgi:hypothetical protein
VHTGLHKGLSHGLKPLNQLSYYQSCGQDKNKSYFSYSQKTKAINKYEIAINKERISFNFSQQLNCILYPIKIFLVTIIVIFLNCTKFIIIVCFDYINRLNSFLNFYISIEKVSDNYLKRNFNRFLVN